MAGNLLMFYNNAVNACNSKNPMWLYSMNWDNGLNGQPRRSGGTFNSDPWYGTGNYQYADCSGFVSYMLYLAGFTENNLAFTTFSEEEVFNKLGWSIVDYYKGIPLQKGDVLWYNRYNETKGEWEGHTEIVYDNVNRWTMGAKGRGSSWGNAPVKPKEAQVSIGEYNTDNWYTWKKLARCPIGGTSFDIISKDDYLTDSEMLNNAFLIVNVLANLGYTMETICAILGNMARESTMSPIFTERGGVGYGLVQWTPKSDLTNIVTTYNLGDYTKYDVQCKVFDYECGVLAPNTQWYDNEHRYLTNVPFMDFANWKQLTESQYTVEDLTASFMVYYERPRWVEEDYRLDIRQKYARIYYDMFKNGIFNGAWAFNSGNSIEERRKILLIDYVRRKNAKRVL